MGDTFEPAMEHILDNRLNVNDPNGYIKLILDGNKIWHFSTFEWMDKQNMHLLKKKVDKVRIRLKNSLDSQSYRNTKLHLLPEDNWHQR